MSRYPWLLFILVGLLPPLLLPGNVLGHAVSLAALFPAVAAMLVLSSGDEPEPLAGDGTRRSLIAAGVIVVLVGTRLAWAGLDGLIYKALVFGVPAVLAAWVLSGVYSPSPVVRRWVRSLVAAGTPRGVLLVALLAWPLVAVASVAASAVLPGLSVAPMRLASVGLLGVLSVTGALTAALAALAWYGFAARLLLARLNPLATGLLIGVVQWPVVWGLTMRPATVLAPFFLVRLAGFVAAAIVSVWACERSRGSLLAVWILGIASTASQALVFLTVTPDDVGGTDTPHALFSAGQVAIALVLVVAGRMWGSPAAVKEAAAQDSAESELSLS